MWQYYDFRTHWHHFLQIWKTTESVQNLFTTQHIQISKYWEDEIFRKTKDYIQTHNVLPNFRKRMKDIFPGRKKLTSHDAFFDICHDFLLEENIPKKDSIESILCFECDMTMVFYEIAIKLFEGDHMFLVDNDTLILNPTKRIVFDLYGYYFDIPLETDYYYESLCIEDYFDEDFDF